MHYVNTHVYTLCLSGLHYRPLWMQTLSQIAVLNLKRGGKIPANFPCKTSVIIARNFILPALPCEYVFRNNKRAYWRSNFRLDETRFTCIVGNGRFRYNVPYWKQNVRCWRDLRARRQIKVPGKTFEVYWWQLTIADFEKFIYFTGLKMFSCLFSGTLGCRKTV